ncbi:cytochrome b5, partial [Angomonas deanei]
MTQAELTEYTWEEIRKHDKDDDCWVVLYNKVLNVSEWLSQHPGGLDPIKDMSGTDITNQFESIGHTSTALVKAKTFTIGKLKDSEIGKDKAGKVAAGPAEKVKWSETGNLREYKDGGGVIPL